MNYLIDSHCHLHDREFFTQEQAEKALETASSRGVEQIICIGTSHEDSLAAQSFSELHKNVFWTYGVHPESAENYAKASIKTPKNRDKLVGIGEIGLDYHYSGYNKTAQFNLLERMIDLSISLDLPCSFHVRDALPDFFSLAANFPKLKPSVLHSFSDSKENLSIALEKGFFIGINGLITFANLDCFKELSPEFLDRIILETDAPFLTPVPKRGKINEPGNIKDIALYLANKLGVSEQEIAEKTTNNVRKIFNLPDSGSGIKQS
ncbi:TatD family hydrolase [Candidatus Saccharibacteria bacterium]|nr:TatD family hydrolase [Candidatus Saccharibacteria bacterium]